MNPATVSTLRNPPDSRRLLFWLRLDGGTWLPDMSESYHTKSSSRRSASSTQPTDSPTFLRTFRHYTFLDTIHGTHSLGSVRCVTWGMSKRIHGELREFHCMKKIVGSFPSPPIGSAPLRQTMRKVADPPARRSRKDSVRSPVPSDLLFASSPQNTH